MRFRVTSITGTEEGARVNAVTVKLEDALNKQLSKRDFGSNVDQVSMVVVSSFDDVLDNHRWAAAQSKLTYSNSEFSAERLRVLSIGVPVNREVVLGLRGAKLSEYVSAAVAGAFSVRPKRVAIGLDYLALSSAVQQVVGKYANSAA